MPSSNRQLGARRLSAYPNPQSGSLAETSSDVEGARPREPPRLLFLYCNVMIPPTKATSDSIGSKIATAPCFTLIYETLDDPNFARDCS